MILSIANAPPFLDTILASISKWNSTKPSPRIVSRIRNTKPNHSIFLSSWLSTSHTYRNARYFLSISVETSATWLPARLIRHSGFRPSGTPPLTVLVHRRLIVDHCKVLSPNLLGPIESPSNLLPILGYTQPVYYSPPILDYIQT